jgi:hypothetical protein
MVVASAFAFRNRKIEFTVRGVCPASVSAMIQLPSATCHRYLGFAGQLGQVRAGHFSLERFAGPRLPGSRPVAVAMLILRDEAFNRSNRARTGSGSAAAGAWCAHFLLTPRSRLARGELNAAGQDNTQTSSAAAHDRNIRSPQSARRIVPIEQSSADHIRL